MRELQKVEDIYHAALKLSRDSRERFLLEKCGDDLDLRREVDSLLSFDEDAEKFLEVPPEDVAADIFVGQGDENDIIGIELGHYRVLSKIGSGGMGEVYLAEDKKLGRRVALKILPPQFSQNRERRSRFELEARAVSALNHPNIITIYGIEEINNTNFIATEFIDGVTLRQRHTDGGSTLDETLDIAIQIAGALGAAHEVGIIHRDIKPANIMVRRDGLVKVLDFGLAKLTAADSGLTGETAVTEQMNTVTGAIMGTVTYMSPEQALGEKLDARTDIFSFGVVLYEMLTGSSPFQGTSHAAIYNAIINSDPQPASASGANIPPILDRIVQRALAKKRDERYQSMAELRSDLKTLQQDPAASAGSFSASLAPAKPARVWKPYYLAVAAIPLAIAALAVIYLSFFYRGASVTPFQSVKLERITAHGLTVATAISPDGKYVVYAKEDGGKQSLWLRQTNIIGETQIVPPSPTKYGSLSFSPDNDSIFFVGSENANAGSGLFQISTLGRNQRKLIDGVNGQVSFSPDGKSLAFVRWTGADSLVMTADVSGQNERQLAKRTNPEVYNGGVSWSPDGRNIAVSTGTYNAAYSAGVALVNPEGGGEKKIELLDKEIIIINNIAWTKDGRGIVICRKVSPTGNRFQLQYAAYPSGELQNITNDLTSYDDVSISADGRTLVSTQREYSMGVWIEDIGSNTAPTQVQTGTGRDDGELGIAWTTDGKLAYVSSEGGAQNIWRVDLDGSNRIPLTTGNLSGKLNISRAEDTGLITYTEDADDGLFVYQVGPDGSNPHRANGEPSTASYTPSANKDWIVYTANPNLEFRIWKSPTGGGEPIRLTDDNSIMPAISPDGKQVAYVRRGKDQLKKIETISINGGPPTRSFDLPATVEVDAGLAWSRDATTIYFVNTLGTVSNIWEQPLDGKPQKAVTDFKEFQIAAFGLDAQGKQFAVSRGSRNRDAVLIRSSR